jgi:hypothetical protein
MPMVGYFDESGTHGAEAPVMIVAGFIASLEQWTAYERDLAVLFTEYGVKKFHAKELRARKGDFKGWPSGKVAKFNSRFLRLADDHLACGFSTVLPADSYRRIYSAGAVLRSARRDTQYALCVRAALWKSITLMQDRPADWPLNLVFENGTGHEVDAFRAFNETRDGYCRNTPGCSAR